MLKDDTLGLGAKRNNGDECTGLDAFQHLLGRLNGKSDEALETERKAREDLKLNLYVERKYGTIRFVPGGWLVGDQVKEAADKEVSEGVADVSEPAASAPAKSDEEDEKARKKEKKSKKRKADSDLESDSEATKEKKDKKKSKKRRAESDEVDGKAAPAVGESLDDVDSSSEAKKSKKDRKKEKKDKKDKKEKRKKDKAGSDSGAEVGDSISKEKKRRKDGESASSAPTPAESSTSTPSGSGYSTPVSTSTRYLARSRFIAQKKMAFADSAALNQVSFREFKRSPSKHRPADICKIFMIKS